MRKPISSQDPDANPSDPKTGKACKKTVAGSIYYLTRSSSLPPTHIGALLSTKSIQITQDFTAKITLYSLSLSIPGDFGGFT